MRFDAIDGSFIDTYWEVGSASHPEGGQLLDPRSMNVGPDGLLYVGTFRESEVFRGAPVGQKGPELFYEDAYLEDVVGIEFDNQHVFFVGNDSENVHAVDLASGTKLFHFGDEDFCPNMHFPHGMTLGPDGIVYIAHSYFCGGFIQVWDPFSRAFVSIFGAKPDLAQPYDVVFGPDGDIFVLDKGSPYREGDAAVHRYDGNTYAYEGMYMRLQMDDEDVHFAFKIEFRPDGCLYVFTGRQGLLRYDAQTGAFVDTFVPSKAEDAASPLETLGGGVWIDVPSSLL
jgi:hypothetical protein